MSFHDGQQSGWTPAAVNTPLTSGDAIWTEPNARSEISLSGTRIRMEGASQLDMLAIDDSQTRLQLDQGRIDIKSPAMDPNQPYEILTPRGTASLLQPGDYYLEAGSEQDPTRLGVRAGAAQIKAPNGQMLSVQPGQVAEVSGDAANPQLRLVDTAPPTAPAYWASRDQRVAYDQPPQYLTADVTGYEDLNAYGSWINDSTYGEVWAPRAVPAGWEPYRTGHWIYQAPWGWTWVDDQPWGFAPYHYGRWANLGGRWVWVPPQRDVRPVYAPALVAFVGGVELGAVLANRSVAPVGWFPLGPREAYVPPYTANHDYYLRLNRGARVQDDVLREHWERAERREAFQAGQRSSLMNQRFATVVPASTFVNSQPVMRAALRVPQLRIATTPVAPVSAPPAPTASFAASGQATKAAPPSAPANLPVARTAVAEMPMLARPTTAQRPAIPAPGPRISATQPKSENNTGPALPQLAPRQGAAPPVLRGATTAVPNRPAIEPQAAPALHPAPQAAPAPQQARPVEPPRPQPQVVPPPQAHPAPPPPQPQGHAPPPPQPQHAAPPPPQPAQAQPAPPPQQPHPAPQQAQSPPSQQPPQPAPQQPQQQPQQKKSDEKK